MQKNTDNYFPLAKLKNLNSFERKVLEGLVFCGISEKTVSKSTPLGIAVSGGADSVSLLLSLNAIFGNENICVITIDHGIRSEEESGGDAAFVEQLCKNYKISCEILKIPYGEISKKSAETKKSIEETARVFRYNFFESFIRQKNLCNLALAHNQNDQTETLLMRFLQGSSTEGMGGIERVRGKFIRPLLDISRDEIEVYLTEKNQKWRTDATNFDIKYFRNKIRNVLVPFLNENFTGWHKAVLMAAKKTKDDEDFIKNCCPVNRYDSTVNRDFFYSLHDSLKRRVFFSALNKAGFGGRFPFKLFEEVLQWQNKKTNKISYENLTVKLDKENIIFVLNESSSSEEETESGFYFFVNDKDELSDVTEKLNIKTFPVNKINFPCIVRSFVYGDKIKTAEGKYKSLSQIFSDWKIPEKIRGKIPVIEEVFPELKEMPQIKALIAESFGFKNWIVE